MWLHKQETLNQSLSRKVLRTIFAGENRKVRTFILVVFLANVMDKPLGLGPSITPDLVAMVVKYRFMVLYIHWLKIFQF